MLCQRLLLSLTVGNRTDESLPASSLHNPPPCCWLAADFSYRVWFDSMIVCITVFAFIFPVVGLVKRQRIFIFDDPTDRLNHSPFNDQDLNAAAAAQASGGAANPSGVTVVSPNAAGGGGGGSSAPNVLTGNYTHTGAMSLSSVSPIVIDGRPLIASTASAGAGGADVKSSGPQ